MTFEKWLEEIELLGIPPSSIESIDLPIAYEQGWTPRQVVEFENKARARKAKWEKNESAGLSHSTDLLIRSLTFCGFLMYLLALGTASFLRLILAVNIGAYSALTRVGSDDRLRLTMESSYVQALWFLFATVLLIFGGSMILLLSKAIRLNAKRFDADLW